jgi:uncharacterized C2H2 Zn-finger protein
MISLSVGGLIVIFVGLPLVITSVLAMFYNFRSMHRRNRDKESIYSCAECGHVYTIARSRPMDRCPRCGNLNEAVRT